MEFEKLPQNIGSPARRALKAKGFTEVGQLTEITEKELLALHGVGPKAIRILKEYLTKQGQSFAE
ncbi:DNA-binding protein [Alkalicoccobacillus porphyridii]|uniref:DNA-binding protein n=1 Tax=Alkalicoccobacillus porphyridii TaxID=2597270 RepID=A0A553ZX19_9BACI|nr:DNA-binding protein [Alkalicoccobacillus porphyridii]TSB45991.1 DNA-binding protein [Alkalicoccobacillus porphyridii]